MLLSGFQGPRLSSPLLLGHTKLEELDNDLGETERNAMSAIKKIYGHWPTLTR